MITCCSQDELRSQRRRLSIDRSNSRIKKESNLSPRVIKAIPFLTHIANSLNTTNNFMEKIFSALIGCREYCPSGQYNFNYWRRYDKQYTLFLNFHVKLSRLSLR